MDRRETTASKKDYSPPEIVHTEKLTGRATSCAKADSSSIGPNGVGPLES